MMYMIDYYKKYLKYKKKYSEIRGGGGLVDTVTRFFTREKDNYDTLKDKVEGLKSTNYKDDEKTNNLLTEIYTLIENSNYESYKSIHENVKSLLQLMNMRGLNLRKLHKALGNYLIKILSEDHYKFREVFKSYCSSTDDLFKLMILNKVVEKTLGPLETETLETLETLETPDLDKIKYTIYHIVRSMNIEDGHNIAYSNAYTYKTENNDQLTEYVLSLDMMNKIVLLFKKFKDGDYSENKKFHNQFSINMQYLEDQIKKY